MKALSEEEECSLDRRVDSCIVLLGVGNGICTCTAACRCLGLLGESVLLSAGDRRSPSTSGCPKKAFFSQYQAVIRTGDLSR